jgi:hypothetical protein
MTPKPKYLLTVNDGSQESSFEVVSSEIGQGGVLAFIKLEEDGTLAHYMIAPHAWMAAEVHDLPKEQK